MAHRLEDGQKTWTYGFYRYTLFGTKEMRDLVIRYDDRALSNHTPSAQRIRSFRSTIVLDTKEPSCANETLRESQVPTVRAAMQ